MGGCDWSKAQVRQISSLVSQAGKNQDRRCASVQSGVERPPGVTGAAPPPPPPPPASCGPLTSRHGAPPSSVTAPATAVCPRRASFHFHVWSPFLLMPACRRFGVCGQRNIGLLQQRRHPQRDPPEPAAVTGHENHHNGFFRRVSFWL